MTLRVTLEIVCRGIEANKHTIGIIEIVNQGSKTKGGKTHYVAKYWADDEPPWSAPAEWPFTHRRSDGALKCLKRALEAGERLFQGQG